MLDTIAGFGGYSWLWEFDLRSQREICLACADTNAWVEASRVGDEVGRTLIIGARGNEEEFDRPSRAYGVASQV